MPKFEKGNKAASKEMRQVKLTKTLVPNVTPSPPATSVEPSVPAEPAPITPEPQPVPVSKTWRCNNPNCGLMWATEKELADHMWYAHKKQYRGGGKMPEGAVVDPPQPITLPGGFMGDMRDISAEVDVYQQLRNILDSFQVRDIREAIVDSFASGENPADVKRLKVLLTGFGVQPSRVNLIVDRWARYMDSIGMAVEDVEEEQRQKERKSNPLKANYEDMANWGPGQWAEYQMQMQKQAMGMKIQFMMMKNMMKSMDMSDMDMNSMGVNVPGAQQSSGQLPRDIQLRLERLDQYEQRDKLKEAIDPVMRAVQNLRADFDDTRQKAEQAPKKDSMAELMDMVKMQALLKNMGGHDKDAEVMRVQMEERIENKRMQQEKDLRELQMKMEAAKQENHALEMRNIQTQMEAKIDNLKTLNEIAARDKGQDLESVINNALRVQDTLKKLQGDNDSDDDKKMKNIMGTVQGLAESFSPAIDKMAQGFLMNQQAKAQQVAPRMPSAVPAGRASLGGGPPMSGMGQPGRPAPPPTSRKLATCTHEGCGIEFEINGTSNQAECPGCHTVYDIGYDAGQGRPSNGAPAGNTMAKKDTLMKMDRPTLDEYARAQGIEPDQFPTHEMLVNALMGN